MNKLILLLLSVILFTPVVFAEDCMHDAVYERNWNAEITTGMRVRDIPCMETSVVLTTVPVGEVVKVIAETDGYYKVRLKDGTEGWSGQWLLKATNKPFNEEAPKEPLYDIAGHKYETAVRYLEERKVIQGYPDGAYRPDNTVNRAEFTKILVGAKLGKEPAKPSANCFPDVSKNEWYAPYVCYAKTAKIIGGYPDGTFKPGNTINLAEAVKILVNTLNVDLSDTSAEPWYRPYIEAMQNQSYIPDTFSNPSQNVNRAQMAEMVWRIMEEKNDQSFAQFQFTESTPVTSGNLLCVDDHMPSNINLDTVRSAWLDWYNGVRTTNGLHAYKYNDALHYSAVVWSEYSKDVGKMSHTRPGQTDYYDYNLITKWFENLGITFKNHSGVTYSENIGYGTYRCSVSDCTQSFINAIRPVFDMFMAEKGTSYTAHYDSVMNAYFNEIGIGFAVDVSKQIMYLTVHYAAEAENKSYNICSD